MLGGAAPPGGRLVANAVTLETEAVLLDLHARHGGELTRLAVSRAEPVGGAHRLAAADARDAVGAGQVSGAPGGILYGIGVGPGDPELMTLKADRLIRAARVVAYPAPDTGESFARAIAARAISPDAVEIPMIVPMREERFAAQEVYAEAARTIGGHLAGGADVVVLCEGDPFFYGSFMYLFARLAGRHPVEVVPGVSSLAACAAALGRPLVARNGVLSVLPGPLPDRRAGAADRGGGFGRDPEGRPAPAPAARADRRGWGLRIARHMSSGPRCRAAAPARCRRRRTPRPISP